MRNFHFLFFTFIYTIELSGQVRNDTIVAEKIDTTAPIVRTWILKDDYSRQENYHLDTLQTFFQIYNPVMRYSFTSSYLGNLGLSARSNNYFSDKGYEVNYLFLDPYKAYIGIPATNIYYNVRKPYSLLEYSTTMQNRLRREQMVRVLHSQNITKFMNAGLDIKMSSSEGRYSNQKAKVINFRFFGSYNKGDYSLHTSFASNTFKADENGGIRDDSLFLVTVQDGRAYNVNLTKTNTLTRNMGLQITQRYRFGKETEYIDTLSATGIRRLRDRTSKTGSIIHTFEYERDKRIYMDDIAGLSPSFYRNFYINQSQSNDSTFQQSVINTLQLMLDENPNRKNDFGARAFISHELVRYLFNKPPDTIVTSADTLIRTVTDRLYNNIYAGASLVHTVGKGWNWNFIGKIWLSGYKAGDMILKGEIDKFIQSGRGETSIMTGGSLTLTEPAYFLQHYASNHFRWENDFNKTKEIIAFVGFNNEPGRFSLKGYLSTISDFIYMETDTLPSQHHPMITLFSTELYKHFKVGPFQSVHHLLYQLSTNKSVIRIPDLSYYTSNFFAFTLIKNVLTVETGIDITYYTKYYGLAYMPSFGLFYNQDEHKLGNYPYFDLFITAKVKRTRLYFKFDHVNSGLMGKDYFQVLHYPMPPGVLKFGLSWTFYD